MWWDLSTTLNFSSPPGLYYINAVDCERRDAIFYLQKLYFQLLNREETPNAKHNKNDSEVFFTTIALHEIESYNLAPTKHNFVDKGTRVHICDFRKLQKPLITNLLNEVLAPKLTPPNENCFKTTRQNYVSVPSATSSQKPYNCKLRRIGAIRNTLKYSAELSNRWNAKPTKSDTK